MNAAGRRMQMRDAAAVIVLCTVTVLTAGALSMGGRLHAKTLMCQKNLREIGKALVSYADIYDGALPALEYNTPPAPRIVHYYVIKRAAQDQQPDPTKYTWLHLGCLFGAGLIGDGRTLYCPAARGGLDEYLAYASSSPWGVLPQYLPGTTTPIPTNASNQWLRTIKGYVYWPQSTVIAQTIPGDSSANYKVGYPNSATSLSNLDKNKSVVSDIVFHKEGQFKASALFWDGSVIYQDGPNVTGGNRLYFHTMQFDDPAAYAAGWTRVTIAEWMWKLHK